MPRKAKSQGATKTAPGQAYGMAGEQVAAMEQIPLPQTSITGDAGAAMGGTGTAPNPAPQTEGVPPTSAPLPAIGAAPEINVLEKALADAAAMPQPAINSFSAPVGPEELQNLPATPVTRQMSRMTSPVVDLLQSMALAHGNDARLEELANNAARLGY